MAGSVGARMTEGLRKDEEDALRNLRAGSELSSNSDPEDLNRLDLLKQRLLEARKEVSELRESMAHMLNSRGALPTDEELRARVRPFIDEEEAQVQHD